MPVSKEDVPTLDKLISPTLRALHTLGGSASIRELVDEIDSDLELPENIADLPHGRGGATEVEYRAAWARTYMKNFGLLEYSERGVWALTPEGLKVTEINSRDLVRSVQKAQREAREAEQVEESPDSGDPETQPDDWRSKLLEVLLNMDPTAFRDRGFNSRPMCGNPPLI